MTSIAVNDFPSVGESLQPLPASPIDPRVAPPIFEDRWDVAGFKPSHNWRGKRSLEIMHPLRHNGGDDETGVLVLDLDDIAPASAHSGHSALGHIHAASFALGIVGVGLAWGLGAYPAFKQMFESRSVLKELKEDDTTVNDKLADAEAGHPAIYRQVVKNAKAALRLNQANRRLEYVKGTFAGAIAGTGMTVIGGAIILGPEMFGALSATSAAIAAPLLTIGSVLVPIFCAGMVGYEGYRTWRATQVYRHSSVLARHQLTGTENRALDLLHGRLNRIRNHALANSASYIGLAVGAPLTSFVGPIGLAVLLPGVVGLVVAGYYHSKHLHYSEQLSPEQRLRLGNKHEIANRVVLADEEYRLLKQLKAQKRLLYPYAEESPPPVRQCVLGINALRKLGGKHLAYEPAEITVHTYLERQAELEVSFYQNQGLALHAATQQAARGGVLEEGPVARALAGQGEHLTAALRHAQHDAGELREEAAAFACLDRATWMFSVCRFLVRKSLFPDVAKAALDDADLEAMLMATGIAWEDAGESESEAAGEVHVDANALVLAMADTSGMSQEQQLWLQQAWARHTQDILFKLEKTRAKYRRHELLDILGQRIESHAKGHDAEDAAEATT